MLARRGADRVPSDHVASPTSVLQPACRLADALVLLVALRASGVPASALSVVDVLGPFLLAYPLTLLPLFGLGVLDAVLLGAWVTVAGVAHEPAVVAALVVWRVVTILGTLALGLPVLAWWRRGAGR